MGLTAKLGSMVSDRPTEPLSRGTATINSQMHPSFEAPGTASPSVSTRATINSAHSRTTAAASRDAGGAHSQVAAEASRDVSRAAAAASRDASGTHSRAAAAYRDAGVGGHETTGASRDAQQSRDGDNAALDLLGQQKFLFNIGLASEHLLSSQSLSGAPPGDRQLHDQYGTCQCGKFSKIPEEQLHGAATETAQT